MKIEDKEKRLNSMLEKMTGDEIKKLCYKAYINGLENGMQILKVASQ